MKQIVKTTLIPAPVAEVWLRWSTPEGLRKFFGEANQVEWRIGGKFEIYFSMDAPEGLRGSEGCKLLSYLPNKMISFSWNAPPSIPAIREKGPSTWVVVELTSVTDISSEITLTHLGWQEGAHWEETYNYFDHAWELVLEWLCNSFKK